MKDYYNLFPYCTECHRLRLAMNRVENLQEENAAEAAYAQHLLQDHKITREEVAKETGVMIAYK
ncbi:MAG: hypothetical protein GH143_02555 [Calditrichaeota bacterium]|nr:hypothetical protein [Calditrichota bacterium]